MKLKNTGFYSGSFDPIHIGHLQFALKAIKECNLSEVYFLPERQHRHKLTSHYAHRLAMIKLAIKPYPKLKVLELPETQLTVNKTLPKLKSLVGNNQIFFLQGSDDIKRIPKWPNYQTLLKSANFIIGIRSKDKEDDIKKLTKDWSSKVAILNSQAYKDISSGQIRDSLMQNMPANGLLASTKKYIKNNWLYISLDNR